MCELEKPINDEHREAQRLHQKRLKYGWDDKDLEDWINLKDFVLSDKFLEKYDLEKGKW